MGFCFVTLAPGSESLELQGSPKGEKLVLAVLTALIECDRHCLMSCEAISKEQEFAQPFSSLASRSSILPALPPAGLPGETLSAIGVPCHVAADQVMSSMYEVRAARTRQELCALQQRVLRQSASWPTLAQRRLPPF